MNYYEDISFAIDYIESYLFEELSLDIVAKECHISKFHFLRIFKAVTAYNPQQYIDKRRLSEAIVQLKDSHKTITDIAFDCGFGSPEVFSRKVKKEYGHSPRSIKKDHIEVGHFPRLSPLNRDFKNHNKSIITSYKIIPQQHMTIYGTIKELYIHDLNQLSIHELVCEKLGVKLASESFPIYFVVLGLDPKNGYMKVLIGDICDHKNYDSSYQMPQVDYALFTYNHPSLGTTLQVVVDDILRTIVDANLQIDFDGVDLRKIYLRDEKLVLDVLQPFLTQDKPSLN